MHKKYAISDIHGCRKTFEKLLQSIDFSTEDQLYLLGDYVDRGPDSKGVIDLIIDLRRQGMQVQVLRGNHEQMLYSDYYNGAQIVVPYETLRSFRVQDHKDIPKDYIDWISGLEYYLTVDDFILVHAGLDFSTGDPLAAINQMMWMRWWYDDIDRHWLDDRIIVHGHTPIERRKIEKMVEDLAVLPVIDIDNGCAVDRPGMGSLCCLDLTSLELYFQENID